MKRFFSLFGILLCMLSFTGKTYAQTEEAKPEKETRINVKLNGLVVIGVFNPAVEFKVMEHWTAQLEAIGIFYAHGFLGSDKPLTLGATFGEFRYYPKKAFKGFYAAPAIGWGIYRMTKGIVPGYEGEYPDSYQVGYNMMLGLSVGYVFEINKHWCIELNWGGGYQNSTYEGFHNSGYRYVGLQGSGEWLPVFKGGVFVTYKF